MKEIYTDNLKLFSDLGTGIPMYAILEILWDMRDKAGPDIKLEFDYFVRCKNGFNIKDTHNLGLCLLANARCVGMELLCVHLEPNIDGSFGVYFNKKTTKQFREHSEKPG